MDLFNSLLAVIVGGLVGWAINTIRYRRTSDAMLFCEYAKRYDGVVKDLYPILDQEHSQVRNDTNNKLIVMRYLNLCSEELWLWQHGYIRDNFWEIWETEMAHNFHKKPIKIAWKELRKEYIDSDKVFCMWIENPENYPKRISLTKRLWKNFG